MAHGKPAPDIFLKACDLAKTKPSDALVLEDSDNGAMAAFQAKIPYIVVPDLKHPDTFIADNALFVAADLDVVAAYLKKEFRHENDRKAYQSVDKQRLSGF